MNILFYAKRNLHLPHLEPIRRWISSNCPSIEWTYSSPPYVPSREGIPGCGFDRREMQSLDEQGIAWIPQEKIINFAPDVTVMADAEFAGINWGGKIVNVNHGLICKGTFYTEAPTVRRENGADLICVPGPYHEQILNQAINRPVYVTGLVKFDPIGRGELTRESARRDLELPDEARVVLFAPTFNLELSAVPVVVDRIRELADDETHVLVKLHGMSPANWVELYRLISLLEDHVHYIDEMDVTPCLVAADVVISDVSSAFMEAVALDRPVVLVNNPLRKSFKLYDPQDIEYSWRDVGLQVETATEMIAAVERCFANPLEKALIRAEYGPKLVGKVDGLAAERAALAILHVGGMTEEQMASAVRATVS